MPSKTPTSHLVVWVVAAVVLLADLGRIAVYHPNASSARGSGHGSAPASANGGTRDASTSTGSGAGATSTGGSGANAAASGSSTAGTSGGLPGLPGVASGGSSASPTPTVPVVTSGLGTPANPGQLRVAAPGTYHYAVTGKGEQGGGSSLQEKITDEGTSGGLHKQLVEDSAPSSRSGGGGPNGKTEVGYRSGGVYLLDETITVGQQSYSCSWTPPVETLVLPIAVGNHWTFQGNCSFATVGETLTMTGSAKVTGVERIKIGADVVDVWDVQRTTDVKATGPFSFTSHVESAIRFAPRQGLIATETDDQSFSSAQGSSTATDTRQIQSLRPA